MITVYKYPIQITDKQYLTLPNGYHIVHVGLDPTGAPCIWALVDTERSLIQETVYVVGTGHLLPFRADRHLGSFVDGSFVWHVFLDKIS